MSEKAKPAAKPAAKKVAAKAVASKAVKPAAKATTNKLAGAAAAIQSEFKAQKAAAKTVKKPASKLDTKQASAELVAAKKTVAKKAVAKKAVAKKATAKKAAAKKPANLASTKTAATAARSGKKPSSSGLPARKESATERLRQVVLKALDDMKAKDVVVLDVRPRTSITDELIFASGTSTRHVKSLADEVVKAAKANNMPPIGVEGEREGEWVLVDLADVVVHVMLPATREFYGLERLWSSAAGTSGE